VRSLLRLRPRCVILVAVLLVLGLLPLTYSLLADFLLRYGEARFAIRIGYPEPLTRVIGALSSVGVALGICLLWGDGRRTVRGKATALVGIVTGEFLVMGTVGLIVRAMTLEYFPNEAAIRWFVPVGGLSLLTGAVVSATRRKTSI
jgi:hypothetical protein